MKHRKIELIPENLAIKLIVQTHEVAVHSFSRCVLPYWLYLVCALFILLSASLSTLMPEITEFFPKEDPISAVINALNYLLKLGLVEPMDENYSIISFLIPILIFIATLVPIAICLMFKSWNETIPKTLSVFFCVSIEIVQPIIATTFPMLMASIVCLFVNNTDQLKKVVPYIEIIIILFLFVVFLIIQTLVVNSTIPYCKGRTLTWNGNQRILIFGLLYLAIFFIRITVFMTNELQRYFSIVVAIVFLITFLYIIILLPIIDRSLSSIFLSLLVYAIFTTTLNTVRLFNIEIEASIVVFIGFISIIALYFLFYMLLTCFYQRIIERLESCSEREDYPSIYNKRCFVFRDAQIGFQFAVQEALNWELFEHAILEWPKCIDCYKNWIRLLAIYSNQNGRLKQILRGLEDEHFPQLTMRLFINELNTIPKMREKNVSRESKHEIKLLDMKVHTLRSNTLGYWRAVTNGYANSAYSQIRQSLILKNQCDNEFKTLINSFPNNPLIYKKYSDFLKEVEYNYQEGDYWSHRSEILDSSKSILVDPISDKGFEIFPLIPHHFSIDYGSQENLKKNNGVTTESSECSSNSSYNMIIDVKTDETKIEAGKIAKIGASTKISEIDNISIVLGLFTAFAFVGALLIPAIIVVVEYGNIEKQFEAISYLGKMSIRFARARYHAYLEAVGYVEIYEAMGLGQEITRTNEETFFWQQSGIQECVLGFDRLSQNKNVMTVDALQKYNNDEVIFENGDLVLKYNQAVMSIIISLNGYNKTDNMLDTWWLKNIMTNTQNTSIAVHAFIEEIADEIISHLDGYYTDAMILIIIMLAIAALFLALTYYLSIRLSFKWELLMRAIQTLPQSAIQKSINHMMVKLRIDQTHSTENQIYNSLKERESSSNKGIPIGAIIVGATISFIISVVMAVVLLIMHDSTGETISNSPKSLVNTAKMLETIVMSLTKARRIMYETNPANIPDLGTSLKKDITDLKDAYTKMLFGANINKVEGIFSLGGAILDSVFAGENSIPAGLKYHSVADQSVLIAIQILSSMLSPIADGAILGNVLITTREVAVVYALSHKALDETMYNVFYRSEEALSSVISDQIIFWLVASICFTIFGFSIYMLIFWNLQNIKKTIQYSLQCLASIDAEYIHSSEALTAILSNSAIHDTRKSAEEFFEFVNENSESIVVECTHKMTVVAMNKSGRDIFIEPPEKLEEMFIDSLFQFTDQKLNHFIEQSKHDGAKFGEYKFETSLVQDTETLHNCFVTVVVLNEAVYVITSRNHRYEELKIHLVEERKKMEDITIRIFPHDVREMFRKDTSLLLMLENCIVGCFRLLTPFSKENDDIEKSLDSIGKFKSSIYEVSKTCEDSVVAKSVGMCVFVVFNMKKQVTSGQHVMNTALLFVQNVMRLYTEKGVNATAALGYAGSLVSGRVSELSTNFNIFAPEVKAVYSASHAGNSGRVVIDIGCFKLASDDTKLHMHPVKKRNDLKEISISELQIFNEE